tara:strand:+ start:111 stop:284 length:174 start_codon:yes stop_codon:yes gene_type:complete
VGAIAFLALSTTVSGKAFLLASAVGWTCGTGSAIFSSAAKDIKRLNQRIAKLESTAE